MTQLLTTLTHNTSKQSHHIAAMNQVHILDSRLPASISNVFLGNRERCESVFYHSSCRQKTSANHIFTDECAEVCELS